MLALFLDRHGIGSVVFDAEHGPCELPRGNTHNARTMEHYRRLGLAGRVRRLGLPPEHITDIVYFTRYNGYELSRLPLPAEEDKQRAMARAERTDQVPEPVHRANQMYVERLLYEQARTRPNIVLRFGCRVTGFDQDPAGVTVRTAADADWRAGFLVGCDGGQSLVRRSIGVHYQGPDSVDRGALGRRATAAYLRLPTLFADLPARRRGWSYWAMNAELAMNLISLNGTDEFFLLTSSVDPDTATADELTNLVHRGAGARVPVQVMGHRAWKPGAALVAERFAAGRVFLAGDSAHLFTPTGGFGMNTGVDDVANLSWKLAATLQGWGGPGLLGTYETERMPIALRNTAAARTLNLGLADIERPAELEADTPAGQEARRLTGARLAAYGESTNSIGVQLGARYDDSPIVQRDAEPPPDDWHSFTASGVPGGRAPHLWLDDWHGAHSSLFDHLGIGLTVLRLGPSAPPTDGLEAAARARRVPLTVLNVADPAGRDLYQRDLVLIRPDRHVAWRANALPADVDGLLNTVTGGRPAPASPEARQLIKHG
jgi:2-polyprenyl-6-methoxyphenol hydroxylase-like FAD-dependent oxidoreductase